MKLRLAIQDRAQRLDSTAFASQPLREAAVARTQQRTGRTLGDGSPLHWPAALAVSRLGRSADRRQPSRAACPRKRRPVRARIARVRDREPQARFLSRFALRLSQVEGIATPERNRISPTKS